jgi:hypothetical protein
LDAYAAPIRELMEGIRSRKLDVVKKLIRHHSLAAAGSRAIL